MGLGQTMLTIMALILMGRVILMMNTSTLDAGYTKDMAEYRITASSLGTSTLEYANALAFDKATADTFVTPARINELTSGLSLGVETGEDPTNPLTFDDIDDYNGYSKIESVTNSAIFKTRCKVTYMALSGSTLSETTNKTFIKKITVYVTSDYLVDYSINPPRPDTLVFHSIFSYWYFR